MHEYAQEICRWIEGSRLRRMSSSQRGSQEPRTSQALVLFGSGDLDKRQLCQLVCKDLSIKVSPKARGG